MTNQPDKHPTEKARVVLLSGFLGAGKTTLLKQILAWETDLSDTVVLVNEFGDVGIDGALLKDSGSDVVELTSGCICCTLSADLRRSLIEIWERYQPRRILIESSGVADPSSTAAVLNSSDLARFMTLSKIITVLEAEFWEAREAFGPLFHNQLAMADLILLNKIDLIADSQLSRFLEEIHRALPDSRIVPTIHCRIDPQVLWAESKPKSIGLKPIHFYRPIATGDRHLSEEKTATHQSVDASQFVSFAFTDARKMDEDCFNKFIAALPWEVFRIKGPVQFADRTAMLNFVGGKSEWLPWEEDCRTNLVFIGWDIDPAEILNQVVICAKK